MRCVCARAPVVAGIARQGPADARGAAAVPARLLQGVGRGHRPVRRARAVNIVAETRVLCTDDCHAPTFHCERPSSLALGYNRGCIVLHLLSLNSIGIFGAEE
eukprot:5244820-Prymnesium_polylepis.1